MNLRVDTDVVRGGGTKIHQTTERLASTLTSAETTLQSAVDNVGQPAVEKALTELLTTMQSAHPRVTTGLTVFAREVQLAADAIDQTDAELADAVPEAP